MLVVRQRVDFESGAMGGSSVLAASGAGKLPLPPPRYAECKAAGDFSRLPSLPSRPYLP
jgi:hypothetical protein